MNQVKNLRKLSGLSYFDKNTLFQVMEVSQNTLYANIKRWTKNGELLPLKNGLYVTGEYFKLETDKDAYAEFIANKLREPSYLSTEYVLQKYNMLTEAVFVTTSVTLKAKREYANKLGRFIYRGIREPLFTGYEIVVRGRYQIKTATKAKALFDTLYLKTFRVPDIDEALIESFRFNFDEMTQNDIEEFSKYCDATGVKKFRKLPQIIRGLL